MRCCGIVPIALLLGCSDLPDACLELASHESALRVAQPDAGLKPIPAQGALAAVFWQDPDDEVETFLVCTATRVAPGTYLTARHCIPSEHDAQRLLLRLGSASSGSTSGCAPARSSDLRARPVAVHEHLDLALLATEEVEGDGISEVAAREMALARRAPDPGDVLYIAGFGLTETLSTGELRAITAHVLSVDDTWVTVQGVAGGACVGDSGGPLYSLDNGEATLFGVLSAGSASCLGTDHYVDIARAHEWIASTVNVGQP